MSLKVIASMQKVFWNKQMTIFKTQISLNPKKVSDRILLALHQQEYSDLSFTEFITNMAYKNILREKTNKQVLRLEQEYQPSLKVIKSTSTSNIQNDNTREDNTANIIKKNRKVRDIPRQF
jgi:uncharacterized Zn-finger protein